MELPFEKVPASQINPATLLLFGMPKVGKTKIISQLDNCLLIDLEKGSRFVDATKVEIENFSQLKELKEALSASKIAKGTKPYKYIAIDTVTELEDIVLPLAKILYMQTPMGKNFKEDDVKKLANGAGYLYLREAFFAVIDSFKDYCDTLILIGHVKDKMIEKEGQELTEKSVDLTGKIKSLTAAKVDAIGYMYAQGNQRIIDFSPSEEIIGGCRAKHLEGRKIVISDKAENGEINVNWNQIFIEK
jgi:hypothetical protein